MKTHPVRYVGRLQRYTDPQEITYLHKSIVNDHVDDLARTSVPQRTGHRGNNPSRRMASACPRTWWPRKNARLKRLFYSQILWKVDPVRIGLGAPLEKFFDFISVMGTPRNSVHTHGHCAQSTHKYTKNDMLLSLYKRPILFQRDPRILDRFRFVWPGSHAARYSTRKRANRTPGRQ